MKSTRFALIGILAITAFAADNYTIQSFSGNEVGTPDQYIDAEFGGSLKISTSGTVENVQAGRFYVRQKFEDPFGETPTTYQLYEGREGSDKASLSAFTLPAGIAYGFAVKAKAYASSDADAAADIEKVYFDGKVIYAEDVSQMYLHRGVKVIELIPENTTESSSSEAIESSSSSEEAVFAAVESSSSSAADDDEYCDDDDPDCEEEDTYDVQGDIGETVSNANREDYAVNSATNDVTDRFGVADEVRKWSAWGLVGVAAASIGIGIYDQIQYNDAKSAHDDLNGLMKQHKKNIESACGGDNHCYTAGVWYQVEDIEYKSGKSSEHSALFLLTQRNKKNKDAMDSYSTARNIWFGIAAASIAGSIVLFTW